jgi:hypothetical protein
MRRQIGVGLLRPSLVRYRVVSGFPRGEHLDDEVPLANAECGLFDGHAGRRTMTMMDGEAAVCRRSGVACVGSSDASTPSAAVAPPETVAMRAAPSTSTRRIRDMSMTRPLSASARPAQS